MAQRKAHLDTLAVTAIVTCCFIWGLNQVAAKATLPEIPPLWQACVRSLGGALLVWAWSRMRRIPLFESDGTGPGGTVAGLLFAAEFACIFIGLQFTTASRMVVFQIVAVTFFSFLVWFWLVRHYPATRLSSFTLLTPMFGLVLGAFLLREPITVRLGIALIGVSIGIWLVNRPKREPAGARGH